MVPEKAPSALRLPLFSDALPPALRLSIKIDLNDFARVFELDALMNGRR